MCFVPLACTCSASERPKAESVSFNFDMCFVPLACTFGTALLPKVVRHCGVFSILTWKCASRHNGVQFFISHLPRWLRTRRFREPTFSTVQSHKTCGKVQCSRLFHLFAHLDLLSSLVFLLPFFSLTLLVWLPNFFRWDSEDWPQSIIWVFFIQHRLGNQVVLAFVQWEQVGPRVDWPKKSNPTDAYQVKFPRSQISMSHKSPDSFLCVQGLFFVHRPQARSPKATLKFGDAGAATIQQGLISSSIYGTARKLWITLLALSKQPGWERSGEVGLHLRTGGEFRSNKIQSKKRVYLLCIVSVPTWCNPTR